MIDGDINVLANLTRITLLQVIAQFTLSCLVCPRTPWLPFLP
jgi:hypothetical protein